MGGWETVLAAVGGLVLGLGLGVGWAGREQRRLRRQLAQGGASLRNSVVPVLAKRADALGLRVSLRPTPKATPLEEALAEAVELAEQLQEFGEENALPFSDTLHAGDIEVS